MCEWAGHCTDIPHRPIPALCRPVDTQLLFSLLWTVEGATGNRRAELNIPCWNPVYFYSVYWNLGEFCLIMTSPCNGKASCFHAHPRVFRFKWKFLHIWTRYHEYKTRTCMSVCLSPDETNFNSKSFLSIFDIYTYLNWTRCGNESYEEKI